MPRSIVRHHRIPDPTACSTASLQPQSLRVGVASLRLLRTAIRRDGRDLEIRGSTVSKATRGTANSYGENVMHSDQTYRYPTASLPVKFSLLPRSSRPTL